MPGGWFAAGPAGCRSSRPPAAQDRTGHFDGYTVNFTSIREDSGTGRRYCRTSAGFGQPPGDHVTPVRALAAVADGDQGCREPNPASSGQDSVVATRDADAPGHLHLSSPVPCGSFPAQTGCAAPRRSPTWCPPGTGPTPDSYAGSTGAKHHRRRRAPHPIFPVQGGHLAPRTAARQEATTWASTANKTRQSRSARNRRVKRQAEFMLARMTALIPVDDHLPPISPTPRPPRRVGSPPMTSRVMVAVAPIAGTARVVSARGKILRAWASRSLWPAPRWPGTATPGSSSDRARQVTPPADRIRAVGNWVPGNVGGNPLTVARRWGGVRAARPGRLPDGRGEAAADCGRES